MKKLGQTLLRCATVIAVAGAVACTTDAVSPTGPELAAFAPSFTLVSGGDCAAGQGRMTGGGHQLRVDGVRITRGLTIHCDVRLSNNLEINWPGGNHWHLEKESLTSILCIDDPAYDEWPPAAPFNTFIATAVGSLNGVDGSIIEFRFVDAGEPGTSDEADITVYAPGQGPGQVSPLDEVIVLQVSGQLDGGNLQAHYDQPHG